MNAIRANNVSLKYQRFTTKGCKDIGFTKTEFAAKTQFLYDRIYHTWSDKAFIGHLKWQ